MTTSFDEISQQWLIRFLEHRIGDRRIIRLIQKWLKAGILEGGVVSVSDRGSGQGAVISPLLANILLHYALDLGRTLVKAYGQPSWPASTALWCLLLLAVFHRPRGSRVPSARQLKLAIGVG